MENLYQPDENSEQPLLTVGTITAAGTALLALVASFGLDLSDDQQAAVLAVLAVVAPFIVTLWGRRKVYAPATVARLLRR